MSTRSNVIEALTSLDVEGTSTEAKRDYGHYFTILLFFVLIISLLLAVVAGTRIYGNLRNLQSATNNTRLGVSLITNTVRTNDAVSAVAVGKGPEGNSLVLREILESGTYETRIYLYNGNIVQEYALESAVYAPDRATVIVTSDVFDFSYSNGMLTIKTSQGTSEVLLRSLKGGA